MTTVQSLTFGALLKRHRRAARLTQEALAERAGYSVSYISMLERGERLPTAATVQLLAQALGLSADAGNALVAAAHRAVVPPSAPPPEAEALHTSAPQPEPLESPARHAPLPNGTVTFLFTDIEGSTRLLHQLGSPRYAQVRSQHHALLRAAFAAHGGVEVDTQGDAFFVAFPTAPDAVAATAGATRALADYAWPQGATVRVRIGLHTGTPQLVGDHYVGLDVVRAARIAAAGHGGQVLLSEVTRGLAEHDMPEGVTLRDLGAHRLKDLQQSEQLFQLVLPDLLDGFPPLKTLDRHMHNLPMQPTPLLGREREVADLCALMRREDVRLVTLTGPGGTGKTRLGLQVAAELVDDFAEGVWFVRLSRLVDPALVMPTIAQTLGLQEQVSQPLAATLRAHLAGRHLLLVLDNFEQVVSAAPDVGALLGACPGLKVLVTSRLLLRLRSEKTYTVAPLPLAPPGDTQTPERLTQHAAAALFIERARDARSNFAVTAANARAIAEVCARLDGLPLAIELAAARVRVLPPEALLARLSTQLQLLTGGARDAEERQQTMRATIAWSEALLTPEEQVLFRRLAVFVGGCTLDAAEAVCAAPEGVEPLGLDVLDGLSALVEQSLVQQHEEDGAPRFGLLHIVREFALEQLKASGERAALQRAHAAYLLTLTASSPGGFSAMSDTRWLVQMEREHDNVRATLDWALDQQEVHLALRLGVGFVPFWFARGYYDEGQRRLAAILAADEPQAAATASNPVGASALSTPAVLRAWALSWLARMAANQGDLRTSWHLANECVEAARASGDLGVTAVALSTAFLNDAYAAPASAAVADVAEASSNESARTISTPQQRGGAEHEAALVRRGPDEVLLAEALTLARQSNDPEALAFVLGDAAHGLLTAPQELERARGFAEELLQLSRQMRYGSIEAWTDTKLAENARQRGDVAATSFHARRALHLIQERGYTSWTLNCFESLAWVAGQVGDGERAARILGACVAEGKRLGIVGYTDTFEGEAVQARLRVALGAERWAAAFVAGQTMTQEEAIAEALSETGSG